MKTRKRRPGFRVALGAAILAGLAGCAKDRAAAPPAASAAPQAVAAEAEPQPGDAQALLARMANFLAKTQSFTVGLHSGYDVVQPSGQKIEIGEGRKITVSRPNGLRIESEQSNGEKHVVLYDGKDITVFSPAQNVYAQTAKPGGLDAAVMYFLKDLHMRLPLAVLLTSRFPEEIAQRTQSLEYVERTMLYGTPTHHLAGRTDTVDYQVWITEGAQPLPLRVVLTYRNAAGEPQFRAQFYDWNLSPQIPATQFAFTPPEGARKIAFLAQLPQIAPQGAVAPKQIGGQP